MNIAELDQFSLDDAVKFHDRLNPRLWGPDEHLLPEVRQKLAAVAADFQEFLGVPDLDVEDITVSGSNAAYSYTPGSDIDLHLVVRMPTENSEVYQELFNAKKYQYNNEHDIRIGGADVELYVQPSDQPHHSLGIYSLKDQQWRQVPRRRKITLDDQCVQHKTQDLAARIDQAVTSGDKDHLQRLLDKIKVMRQTGLATTGEFGCDNLVFKLLRRSGHLDRLRQARTTAHDRALSLAERRKARRRRVKYGFGGWFYPGFSNDSGSDAGGGDGGGGGESVHESPDGVSPTTKMFFETQDAEDTVHDFIQHVAQQLELQRMPDIHIHHDRKWSEHNHSFGRYEPETHQLHVSLAGRHLMDTLRTTAHELVHAKQNEIAQLPDDAGQTGSAWENQAHAVAGKIMRHWADKHPEHFVTEASGYIPTAAEKNDPRFAMALSPDVRPGATGKNANRLNLKTDAQGRPGLLMKTVNLREGAARDLNDPPGPETPPTMPAGTVRVDVSDMYDWYKLGQHISNMKGLGRHDFGQGPPSTIFSFGDEDLEHQYIAALKKTGLDTTDIDPAAHDPKSGQKTDPTYNVNEQSGKKSAIYSTDVYGMTAYHSKCLEPGCDWQSRRYDSIKLAQNAAQKHAEKHFKQGVAEGLNEFAPGGGDSGDDGFSDETLKQLAAQWYNGDEDPRVERTLAAAGWEIGHDEGYDDEPGVFVVQSGDEHGRSYMSWPAHELRQGMAENDLVESLRREFELLENEVLGEIKMSPSNLRQEAARTGAMAGMEFEMIVPNVQGEPAEPDYEPDYDQDESVRDIDDAVQFFDDGEYNSRRDVVNLREEMQGQYYEWLDEQKQEQWGEQSTDYVKDWLWRTYEDQWREEAKDAVLGNAPEFGANDEELRAKIEDMVRLRHDETTEDVLANLGSDYDEAYEEWSEDFNANTDMESEWLASAGIETMRDVLREFDIQWPHWYDSNQRDEGINVNDVADEFSRMINKPVNASERYHGARREPGHYVVEPDGSLDPDDSADAGLEFVSPPMPIDELLSDLNKIKKWAGTYGCYTNDSTGLHINISVPDYDLNRLDYVKLALLMGDEYVLKAFGRTGNIYTKSAMGKIKDVIRKKPQAAEALLAKMKDHMDDLATKAIHSGTTEKYTSINTKSGYIEFRSPGGDWLDDNFDKIESTLLRFTVALSAAMNPEAYRQEYLKKLYKLLTPKNSDDPIAYFARYSAGELDKADLRKFIKQVQLQRDVVKGKSGKMWWNVSKPDSFASIEVVASSREEAIEIAKREYPEWKYSENIVAKPSRPYVETEPEYEIFQVAGGNVVQTFRAADNDAARAYFDRTVSAADRPYYDVRRAGTGPVRAQNGQPQPAGAAIPGSTLDLQRQRAAAAQSTDAAQGGLIDVPGETPNTAPRTLTTPGQPQLQFTGNWLILDPEGREIHRFGGVGNDQIDANAVAMGWLRRHPQAMQAGVTVVPEMA